MFAGFNISLSDLAFNGHDNYDSGNKLFEDYKNVSRKALKDYVITDGVINASKLEKDWFPSVDADIFLSHSHKDERLAIEFAGWLYDVFGVKTFIDSCVWGYADDLLDQINDHYSLKHYEEDGSKTYCYGKTNNASAHVNMILNGALAKMIDNTECLFFFNTPNSISVKQSVDKTYSPWIYSELLLSSIVEHKSLSEYRKSVSAKRKLYQFDESEQLAIEYKAYTNHLGLLEVSDLSFWKEINGNNRVSWKSLDKLYKIMGLIKVPIYG